MREYSTQGPAHRTLRLDPHDPQRGDDVKALQREVDQRLDARGEDDFKCGKRDGVYGPRTARACSRASYALGCTDHTTRQSSIDQGGICPIGLQRIIRRPHIRNDRQLHYARTRMDNLLRQRKEREAKEAREHKAHVGVNVVLAAAELGYQHRGVIHYTQGVLRWQGIRNHLIAASGHYPNWADCSSFYTWCWWQVLREGADILNGGGWSGGYTGTLLAHGHSVNENTLGAAWIYGSGWPGKHVAIGIGGGMVISHGSEAGPFKISGHYRRDLMTIHAYG